MSFFKSNVLTVTLFCTLLFITFACSGMISLTSRVTTLTNVGVIVSIHTVLFFVLVLLYLQFSGVFEKKKNAKERES